MCELETSSSWAGSETCAYRGCSLDPADLIFKGLLFAQFWGQCSPSAESCRSLFAAGLCSCRSLPACAAVELRRELPNAKGARRRLGFRFPSLPFTYHSGSRANALWVVFFVIFHAAYGLLVFMHPKKARAICVNMKPICVLLSTCNVVDGATRLNSQVCFFFCVVFCGHSYVAARPSLPLHAYMLSCSIIVI